MTSNHIYKCIDKALRNRFVYYYDFDGLHVYRNGNVVTVDFDVFNAFVLRNVLLYLDKKNVRYTQRKCTRGGYLGGGVYRKFTLISIRHE